MSKLLLHIGTEKTGTSSIQKFLRINKSQLEKNGFFVPSFMSYKDNENHIYLPLLAYEKSRKDDLIISQGILDENKRDLFLKGKLQELQEQFSRNKDKVWLMSSEHCQSRLKTDQELTKLANILLTFFDEITILIYLRRPIDIAISHWTNSARGFDVCESLPKPDDPRIEAICNHKKTLKNWIRCFGKEIIPRIYSKENLIGGSVVLDYCKLIGIKDSETLEVPARTNTAVSFEAIKVLTALNKRINPIENGSVNQKHFELSNIVEKRFTQNKPYLPSKEEVDNFNSYYENSNNWVLKKFFSTHKDLWGKDSFQSLRADHDDYYNIKLSNREETIIDILAEVWIDKVKQNV